MSDIALKKPLPAEIAEDVEAYVGCIAGAMLIDNYRQRLVASGFAEVLVANAGADLNAYGKVEGQSACCSPVTLTTAPSTCCGTEVSAGDRSVHGGLAGLLDRHDVNDYAASVKIYAVKPGE